MSNKIKILEKINRLKRKKLISAKEEDYLEVILELQKSKGYAKQRDISKILNVKASSVTVMLKKLAEKSLIEYEKYGGIHLTSKGNKVAEEITRKHKIILDFLLLLGVDEKYANLEAEGIEHIISEDTLNKIDKLLKFIEQNENLKKELKDYLKNDL